MFSSTEYLQEEPCYVGSGGMDLLLDLLVHEGHCVIHLRPKQDVTPRTANKTKIKIDIKAAQDVRFSEVN